MTEKIKLGIVGVATTIALAGAPVLAVPSDNGDDNPHNKVTICHATASQSNPYVEESPNANGDVSGHDGHSGDIIPPFDYNDNGVNKHYPGKNWDSDHQAILENGCKAGGQGGGGGGGTTTTTTTTTTNNQTTNNTTNTQFVTTGGAGGRAAAPQVAATPQGAVSAGEGGGSRTVSAGAAMGLLASVGVAIAGAARLVVSKRLF